MALEESPSDNDEITEEDGVLFLVSKKDSAYFNNTKIDYTKNVLGNGQFQVLRV
ncbi:hypothetical protein [Virgibacillus sp. DJP39]|uniref:hypothetical protein n=1 Tax=Virgibacillus sp. DJP39 TaxID=3409790 RepID=UPI003BB5685C